MIEIMSKIQVGYNDAPQRLATQTKSPAGTWALLTAGFSLRKGNTYMSPRIPQVPQGLAVCGGGEVEA